MNRHQHQQLMLHLHLSIINFTTWHNTVDSDNKTLKHYVSISKTIVNVFSVKTLSPKVVELEVWSTAIYLMTILSGTVCQSRLHQQRRSALSSSTWKLNFSFAATTCHFLSQQTFCIALHNSFYYRAMHFSAKRGIAIACRLSVRPSVCDVGELW